MTSEALGGAPKDLWLRPGQRLCVEYMQVLQMLVSRVAAEEEELGPQDSHRVSISRHGQSSLHLGRDPSHGVQVEDVDVVEALLSVVAAEHK